MSIPEVFILILNWQGWFNTIECLESLQRLYYQNYRMVVIDNGSADNSVDRIKAWAENKLTVESKFFTFNNSSKKISCFEYDVETAEEGGLPEYEDKILKLKPDERIIIIKISSNLGFAGGNNVGIIYALQQKADYVWLVNNDTVVDSQALGEMVVVSENKANIGFAGSKLLYYNSPDIIQAAGGGKLNYWTGLSHHYGWLSSSEDKRWNQAFNPEYITGASLLVKRKCIEETGLMDESFFFYGEEVDWQYRAGKFNWHTYYCPTSIVYHKEGATAGFRSSTAEFYATRANIKLSRRYAPWTLPTAIIFGMLKAAKRLILFHPARAKAVIRGIVAGSMDQGGKYKY